MVGRTKEQQRHCRFPRKREGLGQNYRNFMVLVEQHALDYVDR